MKLDHLNTYQVKIIDGAYQGQRGSIVSLVTIKPLPIYIVENENGHDLKVSQNEMEKEK